MERVVWASPVNYVTDTHALIWSLFAEGRLSGHVRNLFQQTNEGEHAIFIPTVVVAEAIMVVEKGRVEGTVRELLQGLALMRGTGNYQFLPLLPETVLASHINTAIPDIFDRLIVTETQGLAIPLISRDGTIKQSGLVDVIWD